MKRARKHKRTRRRIYTGTFVIMCALLLTFASICYAESSAWHRFARGFKNCASGWMEFPTNIYETSKEYNPFVGITYGSVKGALKTAHRTGIGVYDVGTFFVPEKKPPIEPETLF